MKPSLINSSRSKQTQSKNAKESQIRIIGGTMRGRKISFLPENGLRPTLDQVRETLFNWLMSDIPQASCLDLFAGSGALGFEALSRGAKSVTFVDSNSKVSNQLKQNVNNLSIKNAEVHSDQAVEFLNLNENKFDIIFLDPPFEKCMLNDILTMITPHLAKNGKVYIEHENEAVVTELEQRWVFLKTKKNSRFCYSLITPKEQALLKSSELESSKPELPKLESAKLESPKNL